MDNIPTTQEYQRDNLVGQMISLPPAAQNPYPNQTNHYNICPTQAIPSAQHGTYGFYPSHSQDKQPILEYNPGYSLVPYPHNTASSNTGNTPGCDIR